MTDQPSRPALSSLRVIDPPDRWRALGFTVEAGEIELGGVVLQLALPPADPGSGERGIVSWGLTGIAPVASIDGLATEVLEPGRTPGSPGLVTATPVEHENGALAIDHVVVTTPDFDRTADALARAGLKLRRVRELPGGTRQGFRRLGQAILELVEAPADQDGAPRFWGLVVVVRDLDQLAERLAPHLGPPKAAVQPGRRIATLRHSAGLGPALAFMTPEP